MTIRVLIADDQALVRVGFGLIVGSAADLEVVGEASTGNQAVELAVRERPDVVLMDIRMPGTNGIDATRRVRAAVPDSRVLILTTFDLDEYVYAALRAGASGFLLKDVPPAELLAAIRVIAGGEALLAPSITCRLIRRFAAQQDPPRAEPLAEERTKRSLAEVTNREREVLLLVSRGMSNTEIADHLVISMATVKTHIARLLAKLGCRDRTQLVVLAYETRLVHPA